jgi:hypothetical protein
MAVAVQGQIDPKRLEKLGPAERTINALTTYTDHCVHNRPGFVVKDKSTIGTTWAPCTWKAEGDPIAKVVYRKDKVGKKTVEVKIGVLDADGKTIRDGAKVVGEYRKPGLYPESVAWVYRQVADIWKMDNEFAAHLASWSFPKDHRDLKVILAAFMLVQSRSGEPVMDDGKVAFMDDDYRAVGEAMLLTRGSKTAFDEKLLLRVGDVLRLPQVATINRELGFGKSARNPAMGRYDKTVIKWLSNLEANIGILTALIKKGWRTSIMEEARRVGFKPTNPKFFELLRWKQKQSVDGRRTLAIGTEVVAAETWEGLDEGAICKKIAETKPNYKRVVGMIPAMTRAIMAACIETKGCISDADLIILTPTLEDLGLLAVPDVKARYDAALAKATNQRAVNIARNVKDVGTAEALVAAADVATAKAMEEVTRGLRVYVAVDKSGSMEGAIEAAKEYLAKFLGGFPLDRCHVSVFNTMGTEVVLKAGSAVAVTQAFRGHTACGGTSYHEGVRVLVNKYKPGPDEDALFIFIGDEGDTSGGTAHIRRVFADSGVNPVAFGMLHVGLGPDFIHRVAAEMGIPCFDIDVGIFNDPYAVTRTLQNLIRNTPVGAATVARPAAVIRKTLVQEILECPLLAKPQWAM